MSFSYEKDIVDSNKIFYLKSNDTGEIFILQGNDSPKIDQDIEEWLRNLRIQKNLKKKLIFYARTDNLASLKKLFDKKLSSDRMPIVTDVDEADQSGIILKLMRYGCSVEVIEFMIQEGADFTGKDIDGITPLHLSAICGNAEYINLLLSYGSSSLVKDVKLNTPLHYACQFGFMSCIMKLLSQCPAQLEEYNIFKQRPIDVSCNKEVYEVLVDYKLQISGELTNNKYSTYNSRELCILGNHTHLLHNNRIDNIKHLIMKDRAISRSISKTIADIGIQIADVLSLSSFKFVSFIGKGSFGEVYLVEKNNQFIANKTKELNNEVICEFESLTNKPNMFALKSIKKEMIIKQGIVRYIQEEKKILKSLDHPFIIKLHGTFQTDHFLFLLMEYCGGKDMSYHLNYEKEFSEGKIRLIAAQLILAIEYLHSLGIVYRDLKPENIVVDKEGYIKLVDFGLAKEKVTNENLTFSFCGSLAYLAPEVITRKGHGPAIDWYMLGVVIYEMCHGTPPYLTSNSTREILLFNIQHSQLLIKSSITNDLKDLLKLLLMKKPNERLCSGFLGSLEIKAHPFFKEVDWELIESK